MLKNIILFDAFGETPFFRIQNQKSFKTLTGACLSIITYNLIFIFSFFTLIDYSYNNQIAFYLIKEEPNFQELNTLSSIQNDFTIVFNFLNDSLSNKLNNVFKEKSRVGTYGLFNCLNNSLNEKQFCLKFNKTIPESLEFAINTSEFKANELISSYYLNIELIYYRAELNKLNKDRNLVIKNFNLNFSLHTNLLIQFKKMNVYSKRPFQSIIEQSFHTLKYSKNIKKTTKEDDGTVILSIQFDILEFTQNIYKFCEDLEAVFYKILIYSVFIYHVFGHISMILTNNSSYIYLTNKYFRFSNDVEENKQFLLKFYKDKQQFQKINIPNRETIQYNLKIPSYSQNVDSKGIPINENNSVMQSSLNNSINYESSKIHLKENPCRVKSFVSKISSRPESTQKDEIESIFKDKRNMWRMSDSEIYITKLFNFKVNLSICSRLRCKKVRESEFDQRNFNYSSKILKNFLSIETLIKVISDVEKLKDLMMNKPQKTIFDFYYLNNYSRVDPSKEIENFFDKKEFISFWKLRPNDEFSKNINSKLLDLFNEDILKCFSNTE